MMKITVKLVCDICNKESIQKVDRSSDINWVCPECDSSERTFIREYDDPEKNDNPIILGRGGRGAIG